MNERISYLTLLLDHLPLKEINKLTWNLEHSSRKLNKNQALVSKILDYKNALV